LGIMEDAIAGKITDEMRTVAKDEGKTPEFICRGIASGRIVIPVSPYSYTRPVGIGKGLRTKVNASIGTSSDIVNVEMEVKKARMAERSGADTLMELSTGGDFTHIRRQVIEATSLSVGSVPLYQAFIEAIRKYGAGVDMPSDDLFRVTEEQAKLGTNFMAIHTGINSICVERLKRQGGRYGGVCSRGGAFMIGWMIHNHMENPLYSDFDYLLEILKEHEVTLSLGNGLRAGAIHDSTDRAQIQELIINSELADKAQAAGVQTIVEGPGHIPVDEIEANVKVMKRMTNERPFYMLGPLVTDIAPGHDHIVAAIGASLSSAYGADFICYVTPAEHLALPNIEDVRQGVVTARIAAHIGDMVKNGAEAREWDLEMGRARRDLNWEKQYELAIDPDTARKVRCERAPSDSRVCTMCGDYCAMKVIKESIDLGR
jgi:phosphomethylpyrimidine synthase